MANVLFPKFKEALFAAGINFTTATIKAQLLNTSSADGAGNFYTYNAAHDFLDDVPSGSRVGTPVTLGSKTITNGVFDAADLAFGATTGASAEALIIYNDTPSTEATKQLIAYFDTATGLPVTPNGGGINLVWDATGIIIL
jgi:hypothetical protein